MAFTIKVGEYEVKGDALGDADEAIAVAMKLKERLGSGADRAQEAASRNGHMEVAEGSIADAVSRLHQRAKEVLVALVKLGGTADSEALQSMLGEASPYSFGIRLKIFNKAARRLDAFDPNRMIEKTVTGRDPRITRYSIRKEWLDEVRRGVGNSVVMY